MPGHICAVVVTTLVLEGWSSKLDPSHSVMDQARSALPGVLCIRALFLGLCFKGSGRFSRTGDCARLLAQLH